MPTFTYQALDKDGKPKTGTVEAQSTEEATKRIKSMQLHPTNLKEEKLKKATAGGEDAAPKKKKKAGGGFGFGGVSTKHLTVFTRQLSTLQDAGLPLLRSLQILEEQQKPGTLKNVLVGVCEEVEGGTSLSESMAKYPRAFDKLYTKMVAAGEVGGVLDVILQRLSEFMEKSQRLKRKIIGAMVYPAVVVFVAVSIVMFIMIFIIPKFSEIFKEFGVKMPGLTQWLVNTSTWLAGLGPGQFPGQGALMICGAPFLIFFGIKLLRKAPPGRMLTDRILLLLPIVGGLSKKTTIARFTRTLGTLINAGVPILEALSITRDTCGNAVFEKALTNVHDSIREGETFAQPLRESKTCDAIVVNMIEVGEETGDIDAMLMKVADNYDEEVDVAVGSLVKLIEPLLVLFLGGAVGTIVIAMFLPMISIIEKLSSGGK
jgi:type IV pilus assembly protein PilC